MDYDSSSVDPSVSTEGLGPSKGRVLCAGRLMQPQYVLPEEAKNFGPSKVHAPEEQQAKHFRQKLMGVHAQECCNVQIRYF